MSSNNTHSDVVIIGGGVMGMSAAYHLARRGAKVTLLEAEQFFGTGSTALNAGGFRHQFSTGVNIELSKLSLSMLQRFEEEFEQPVAYNPPAATSSCSAPTRTSPHSSATWPCSTRTA